MGDYLYSLIREFFIGEEVWVKLIFNNNWIDWGSVFGVVVNRWVNNLMEIWGLYDDV